MTTTVAPTPVVSLSPRDQARVDVSVLVPAKDEEANLAPFMEQIAAAFAEDGHFSFEVIVIDDGSVDGTWSVLEVLQSGSAYADPPP